MNRLQDLLEAEMAAGDPVLAELAAAPAVQILTGPDGPYPSRRQPGHRLYLAVRLTQPPSKPEAARTNPSPRPAGATPMSTEPTYDASNIHLAQGRTVSAAQFRDTGPAGPENEPIPYTLTPKAEPAVDDGGYAQAAAEDRAEALTVYYKQAQAEADAEARYLATQADRDVELDARQMDAQHQDALAENTARDAQAREPEAGV